MSSTRTVTHSAIRSLRAARKAQFACPSRRYISAYGYEQAKALTFQNYGEPQDILKLHSHSISPAHGDLLTVRYLCSPINPADINQLQGVYPTKPTFTSALGTAEPIAVGGNEGVAEVISVGGNVKDLKRGDWVVMKAPGFGTWRTHAQTTRDKFLPVRNKDGITPLQAGTVSVNPCTAYRMLKDFSKLEAGDWFIQNGANSGVGRAAIQLGREWGYKSINIIRKRDQGHDELVEELKSLGANVVVTDEEVMEKGFSDKVKEWTNGGREKVRLGLNCVGGKLVNDMAKTLALKSHMVTYGGMSKKPVTLPTALLIFKNISFDGFWVSKWSEENPEEKLRTVEHVMDLTREGKFKDIPVQEVEWTRNTPQDTLISAVQGTLGGFRAGKGVFMFRDT
ncbi:trans-2-enoyl-CoA reductase-like protein [Myriangium duriaei CBS 260.36]|uniref:enoyl-[acyl-carrier-protein] reductase n=1 Tax=Myriangium duriaei CBS 260.36 TaxID=1168546 RepID=A0A9P4MCH7_9PEZI|nr:trans-2-enoyl-CoA reductase-like protein [Myriangium duriaei CBS 260.36]